MKTLRWTLFVLLAAFLMGCDALVPEPTPTATLVPTATHTATPTNTPTATPTNTPVPTPTPVPTATPVPIDSLLDAGDELFLMSDWEAAETAYQTVLEVYPEDGRGYARLAFLHSHFFDMNEQALEEAEMGAELSPDDASVMGMLSLMQTIENLPDDALSTAEDAVDLDGESAWALAALAQAQLNVGQIDEAVVTAQSAVDLEQETLAEAELTLAAALSSSWQEEEAEEVIIALYDTYGDFIPVILARSGYYGRNADESEEDKAKQLELLEDALDRDPDFLRTISAQSSYYSDEEDYETALALCDEIVEALPEETNGYNCRGFVYLDSEQYDLALESFDLAIDRDLEGTSGYFGRGRVQFFEGNFAEARAEFEKVIELYSYSSFANIFVGYTYLREEETTAAIESFQTGLELNPYSTGARLALGRAFFNEERYEEAEEQFLSALEFDDEDPQLYLDLGSVQAQLDKYEEADASFDKALELDGEEPFVLVSYGDYLIDRNRYYDAQLQYQAALELDEENIGALIGLGLSYALQDNCGGAINTLNKARDLDPDNFVAGELYQQCLRVYRYDNPPGAQGTPINEPTAVSIAKDAVVARLGLGGDRVFVEYFGAGADRVMVIALLTDFDPNAGQQGDINNQLQQAMIAANDAFVRIDTVPIGMAAEAYRIQGDGVVSVGSYFVHRTDAVDFYNGILGAGGFIGKFR